MLYYEGLSCPVCHQRFEDNDDVVVCPHCGLPHHRVCWLKENQCHEADKHGTDEQWTREQAVAEATKGYAPPEGQPKNDRICPHCFTKNAEFAEFCTHCGHTLGEREWQSTKASENTYSPFNRDNAVLLSNEEQELAALVSVNTQYYSSRFHDLLQGRGGGWNWAAFLLGPLWLFYRKQYLLGGILFLFQSILDIASAWLMYPVNMAADEAAALVAMEQMMSNPMMFPAMFLSLLILVAHILLGVKGNHLYLYHCTRRIRRLRERVPDMSVAELSSFGGVSFGAALLFYLLSSVLVNGFIALLLM